MSDFVVALLVIMAVAYLVRRLLFKKQSGGGCAKCGDEKLTQVNKKR